MCGAAGGSHHRVARVKRWTAHDFHKGVQDQERSDKSLGGSQKKHTGHDLTYWKYNLRPIITPKSFSTHIHSLSSKKKKAHTPDHTIARYNHCSVCKQCCPGTAVSGSYSVRILQSFVFYLRGLIRERERDWMWWSNTPSANRNTRGEMDGEISALSTVTFPTLSTLEGRAAQPTRRKA